MAKRWPIQLRVKTGFFRKAPFFKRSFYFVPVFLSFSLRPSNCVNLFLSCHTLG